MATLNSPVELPVMRNSYIEFPMTANIQDPTSWDMVLNDGSYSTRSSKQTILSDYTTRTITKRASRPSSRGQQSILSKPSPVMEHLPQELEAQPVSYFPPRQSSTQTTATEGDGRNNAQDTLSDSGYTTQTSVDYGGSTSSTSTIDSSRSPPSQVYSLPENDEVKPQPPPSPALSTARSMTNSVKKPAVPTSKYKKKPPPSLQASLKMKETSETTIDSPMSSHTAILQSPTFLTTDPIPPQPNLPATTYTPASPSGTEPGRGQAPVQHRKSTASVRKARALHSHPSLPSMRDEIVNPPPLPTASPQSPQPSPQLKGMRGRKSQDTLKSRPSLYELPQPSPAPNTPLPELPRGVPSMSRPSSSRDLLPRPAIPPEVHSRPATSGSTITPTHRRPDTGSQTHTEMANFMTSNSKIVFRRFHDVHVRLLLTLQDEISALEKELVEIESLPEPNSPQLDVRRVNILSELRKLLAEYDHLFSNWKLMQASPADTKTRSELEQYLKHGGTESSALSTPSAAQDLLWLKQHGNDLSCIDLNAKKETPQVAQRDVSVEEKEEHVVPRKSLPSNPPGVKGGGFMAIFASCAGKRK